LFYTQLSGLNKTTTNHLEPPVDGTTKMISVGNIIGYNRITPFLRGYHLIYPFIKPFYSSYNPAYNYSRAHLFWEIS